MYTALFFKYFLMHNLSTNMDKNSANFTVVSEKHFRSTSECRSQPSYPSFLQCVSDLWKKPAKSSVAFNPRFPLFMGKKHF